MDKDLEKAIKKNIKSSGIPLQIFTSIILDKNGWFVKRGSLYPSETKPKTMREIDVIAEKYDAPLKNISIILIIECKKEENKQWVFFKNDKGFLFKDKFSLTVVPFENQANIYSWIERNFKDFHYNSADIHSYYTTTPFTHGKGKDVKDPIYKAIDQLLNGFFFIWKQNNDFIKKVKGNRTSLLYPIIVFDGKLISAEIKGDDLILEEKEHISLGLELEADKTEIIWFKDKGQVLRSKKMIIDVVKKEYLEEFLKKLTL